jgi:hypothetical protein
MKKSRLLFIALLVLPIAFSCTDKEEDPPAVEICNNGIDDDGDGFIDNEDFDCTETGDECSNGIDDDGDGFIDNEDFDCQ